MFQRSTLFSIFIYPLYLFLLYSEAYFSFCEVCYVFLFLARSFKISWNTFWKLSAC